MPLSAQAQAVPDTVWFRNDTRAIGVMTVERDRDGVPSRVTIPGGDTFALDFLTGFTMGARHLRVVPVMIKGKGAYRVVERVHDGPLGLYAGWGERPAQAAFFETRAGEVLPLTWRNLRPHARGDARSLGYVQQARRGDAAGRVLVLAGGLALAAGIADVVLTSAEARQTTVGTRSAVLLGGGGLAVGAGIVWRAQTGPRLRAAVQAYGQ